MNARLLVLALVLGFTPAFAQQPTDRQVEAAAIYQFPRFVEWPPQAFAGPASPLVVGVLGRDPFGADLDATLAGKLAEGRPIAVRRFPDARSARQCHILFVGLADPGERARALAALKDAPVLTVGDGAEFAGAGGMIGFEVVDNFVGLVVNRRAIQGAGLVVSSQLLRLSRVRLLR